MTTKADLLKRIRLNCIDCMGGYLKEIVSCTSKSCQFYNFRSGSDPWPNQVKSANSRKNFSLHREDLQKEKGESNE